MAEIVGARVTPVNVVSATSEAAKHAERLSITYELREAESDYWRDRLGKLSDEFRTQLAMEVGRAYDLPAEACILLVESPAIKVAGTNIMNAVSVPGAPPTILINHGLLIFCYELSRILASRFNPPPEKIEASTKARFANAIALLVRLTRKAYPDTSVVRRPYSISDDQVRIATSLSLCAEWFIVAHETIHCNYHLPDKSALRLIPQSLPNGREEQADLLGTKLLLEDLARTKPHVSPAEIYAGIEVFFHALHLYEASGAPVGFGDHPSAIQRLTDLRNSIIDNDGQAFMHKLSGYSRAIDAMLSDWMPLILERLRVVPS